jgi:phage-related protein
MVHAPVIAQKRLHAVFFETSMGHEPVRDWLRSMEAEDRRRIGRVIAIVEFGWPVGMPLCRSLGKGLYEARVQLKDRIARVFFTIDGDEMIVLHGFVKKSQATPQPDLDLARKRQQLWKNDP